MDLLKASLILGLVVAASAGPAAAAKATVQGYIGSHKLSFAAQTITGTAEFHVNGAADYVAVTEVYPDTPHPVTYHYTVSVPGTGEVSRIHTAEGFGPVTWLIRIKAKPVGVVRITCSQTGRTPVMISAVTGITRSELDNLLRSDRFTLMGLVPHGTPDERAKWAEMLATNLTPKPEYGITAGFSTEIRYANCDRADVKAQLQACAGWSRDYKLPAMLGLVSWWSGTPGHIPDGLGGSFGDLKYQQVCYSPDVEAEENPALKELLGARYDHHYCLSVPNQWSNCPWLTMNSDLLNRYRYARLDEAISILDEVSAGDGSWIDGIYLENEPRYWDTACEAGNPKRELRGRNLWADFGPLAVEAAAKDGVNLDPADGLSNDELSWLHRNVGRYNQEAVDATLTALRRRAFGLKLPVYTHSLQHRDMFPGGSINHAASEWAYAVGARSGIEGMWSQPSDFSRLREWGRWSNLNREENDGRHIDEHLWDLRVAYMMGADLYNSYNWHAIGAERFYGYVREFLANLPVATEAPAELTPADSRTMKMRAPMKLQAFDGIELPVSASAPVQGTVYLVLESPGGLVSTSDPTAVDLRAGVRTVRFAFTTPAESSCREVTAMRLRGVDSAGKELQAERVRLAAASAADVKLSLDLRTQRALSLSVISRAKR